MNITDRDQKLAIVLVRKSTNAHGYTNFMRPYGWLERDKGICDETLAELDSIFCRFLEDIDAEKNKRNME